MYIFWVNSSMERSHNRLDSSDLTIKNVAGGDLFTFVRTHFARTERVRSFLVRYLFENIRTELAGLGGRNSPHTPFRPPRLEPERKGRFQVFSLAANSYYFFSAKLFTRFNALGNLTLNVFLLPERDINLNSQASNAIFFSQ